MKEIDRKIIEQRYDIADSIFTSLGYKTFRIDIVPDTAYLANAGHGIFWLDLASGSLEFLSTKQFVEAVFRLGKIFD